MSCNENDRILEQAYEGLIDEGFDPEDIMDLDLEDAFDFLNTGKLPKELYE